MNKRTKKARRTPLERWLARHYDGTVQQLATALGMRRMSVWRFLHGRHAATPYDLIGKVAAHVGLTGNTRVAILEEGIAAWQQTRRAAARRSA